MLVTSHRPRAFPARLLPASGFVFLGVVAILACNGGDPAASRAAPAPILRDAYSFYVLDPGTFTVAGPETPNQKEFLLLQSGEVELSCGRFAGAAVSAGAEVSTISLFASQSAQSPNWLPGCRRWILSVGEVTIGDQWYYAVTLLVRREPELTEGLSQIQRIVHQRELVRFPEGVDRIVRVYYHLRERDIYILTLSGPAEDVACAEADVRKLLASVRLNASEAVAGAESGEGQGEE